MYTHMNFCSQGTAEAVLEPVFRILHVDSENKVGCREDLTLL